MPEEALKTPHDEEAERGVLGSLILGSVSVDDLSRYIGPADFFHPGHRKIYAAMVQLNAKGIAIDLVTLQGQMRDSGNLAEAGGVSYLGGLQEILGVNAEDYARRVRSMSDLRALMVVAQGVWDRAREGVQPQDVLRFAEGAMMKVGRVGAQNEPVTPGELLPELHQRIAAAQESGTHVTGLRSGFQNLDFRLGGFQPGDMLILAARPSVGKTAFALNILEWITVHKPGTGLFFSLEMARHSVASRLLSTRAEVSSFRMRAGGLHHWERDKLNEASQSLVDSKLFIDDTAGITVPEIRSKARRIRAKHGLDLIVVDYIQLASGDRQRGDSREREVASISAGLKAVAREMNVPVLALSQLNRSVEARQDKRPQLSDLRESGSLEQDADVVMFLHPAGKDDPTLDDREMELIVAKQRNGPIGVLPIWFERETTRFSERNDEHGQMD